MISMRKIFLASENSEMCPNTHYKKNSEISFTPEFNKTEINYIDNGVLMAFLWYLRTSSFLIE